MPVLTDNRPSVVADRVKVNGERLWSTLMELAAIGAYADDATGLRGVNRQSLTDADAAARRLVISWMRAAELSVRIDPMGNIIGRRAGTDPGASAVMSGSHIDTVATAGAFDGCLGVLGALEAVRSLNDMGVSTPRPIDVAVFSEEEGVRFGTDMLGSAVAAGRLTLDYAYGRTDSSGATFGEELNRSGFRGTEPVLLPPPHAFVECHIEQGPILARQHVEVGVVTGVQAISWQKITVYGRAAHAGTTPMELRVDAGLAAARIVVKVREMVDSGRYGQLRANVGHISTRPGLPSVVAERAELIVDLRNPDDRQMAVAERDLAGVLAKIEGQQSGLRIETEQMAKTGAVAFHPGLQTAIAGAADSLGYTRMALMSGAGHDAQEIAAIAPTAMIFIPGENDGISHSPREYSTPDACTRGADVLATTLLRLAQEN